MIHLGGDTYVAIRAVEALLSWETAQSSRITRAFLQHAAANGLLTHVEKDILPPKSVVLLCECSGGYSIYISPVPTATLAKRLRRPLASEYGFGHSSQNRVRKEQNQ